MLSSAAKNKTVERELAPGATIKFKENVQKDIVTRAPVTVVVPAVLMARSRAGTRRPDRHRVYL